MKTKLRVLALALLITFTSFSQTKKVALASFSSSRTVGIDKLDIKHKVLISTLKQLPTNPDFQLSPILKQYHDKFVNQYGKKLPFEFLPVNEVVQSEAYMALKPKNAIDISDEMEIISAEGYKYFDTELFTKSNRKNLAAFIKNKSDGYMTVTTNFEFVETRILMVKYVNILATTEIRLFNNKGKRVFTIREGAKSDRKIIKLAGVPAISPENVLSLCEDALDELMTDLDKRVSVINKKVTSKL